MVTGECNGVKFISTMWDEEKIMISDFGDHYVVKWFESGCQSERRPRFVVVVSDSIVAEYEVSVSEETNDVEDKIKRLKDFVRKYRVSTMIRIIDEGKDLSVQEAEFPPRLYEGYLVAFGSVVSDLIKDYSSGTSVIYYFPGKDLFVEAVYPKKLIVGVKKAGRGEHFIECSKNMKIPENNDEFQKLLKTLEEATKKTRIWSNILQERFQSITKKCYKVEKVPKVSEDKIREYVEKIIAGKTFEEDRIVVDRYRVYAPFGDFFQGDLEGRREIQSLIMDLVRYVVNGDETGFFSVFDANGKKNIIIYLTHLEKTKLPAFKLVTDDGETMIVRTFQYPHMSVVIKGRSLTFRYNFIVLEWSGLKITVPWKTLNDIERAINFLATASRDELVHLVFPEWVRADNVKKLSVDDGGNVEFKYVCQNKEFDGSFNVNELIRKTSWYLRNVPYAEGVYTLDVPLSYNGIDVLEVYSVRDIPRKTGIKKKKVFGPKIAPRSKMFLRYANYGWFSDRRELGYCFRKYCIVISGSKYYVALGTKKVLMKCNDDVARLLMTATSDEDIENVLSMV